MEEEPKRLDSVLDIIETYNACVSKLEQRVKTIKARLDALVVDDIRDVVESNGDHTPDSLNTFLSKLDTELSVIVSELSKGGLREIDSTLPPRIMPEVSHGMNSGIGLLDAAKNRITGETGISQTLRQIRKEKRISQQAVSKETGISPAEISRIENAKDLRVSTLIKYCKGINTIAELRLDDKVLRLC